MKQKIYIYGIIFFVSAIIGTLFKMMHYPGAGVMLTVGFAGLVLIFFPAAIINAYRGNPEKAAKPLYIVTYITLFVIFTSMLFKIMHWPMAGTMLLISLPFPFLLFLPVFLVTTGKIEKFSIYDTVSILLLLSFVSVFNGLLAIDVTKEKLDDSIYIASIYNSNKLKPGIYKEQASPAADNYIESADMALSDIRKIREIIMTRSGIPAEFIEESLSPGEMAKPGSMAIKIRLRGDELTRVSNLENNISKFVDDIDSAGDKLITSELAGDLLGFSTKEGDITSWSELLSGSTWSCWSLTYLGMLENNIILLRNELLFRED